MRGMPIDKTDFKLEFFRFRNDVIQLVIQILLRLSTRLPLSTGILADLSYLWPLAGSANSP